MKVDGKEEVAIYSMKEKPHGVALVIINKTFDEKADSEVKYQPVVCNDELKTHLKGEISALGYKPVLLEDLTKDEMECALCLASSNIKCYNIKNTRIKERVEKLFLEACEYTVSDDNGKTRDTILSNNVTSAGSDSFMVVVVSRGAIGIRHKSVHDKDRKVLKVEDILGCITSDLLAGKPKMVFIQASRCVKTEKTSPSDSEKASHAKSIDSEIESHVKTSDSEEDSHVKEDGIGDSEEEDEEEEPGGLDCVPASQEGVVRMDGKVIKIPRESDRLVYSCLHQDSSPTPRPSMGVVFEILNAKRHNKHLLEMLTSANNSVPGSWKSNMTLRHNIFFC